MAFTVQHLTAAAGQLFVAGGGFMPGRLMLAPVGALLPPGVHAVAAVGSIRDTTAWPAAGGPASAGFTITVPLSATRGDGLVVAATTGAEAEGGDDDTGSVCTNKGAFVLSDIITTQALDALWVLDDIVTPAAKKQFVTKYTDVKRSLERAMVLAAQANQLRESALEIMGAWYGIVELAHAAYPDASLPALPGEQAFIDLCLAGDEPVILGQAVAPLIARLQVPNLGREGVAVADPDTPRDLIRSLFVAVVVSQAAAKTARANYDSGETETDI